MKITKVLIVLILSLSFATSKAQFRITHLVQFSGVIVTTDSLKPVSFTNIVNVTRNNGYMADAQGFFSFVAVPGDTIAFSCLGYLTAHYIIPDTLSKSRYSIVQTMATDYFLLSTAVVRPWPSADEFKQAFLTWEIPKTDLERAQNNLALIDIKEIMAHSGSDASVNYKLQNNIKDQQLYYKGQLPPNNFLSPTAWIEFFQAWKNGDFKMDKD